MHVVVLAYGPAHSTKRAVRRARSLAGKTGQLIAVPATEFARPAIADLDGIKTVNEPGRAGLHEALLTLTEEPTLLLHDDVVITAKGVVAMERSLHCGNRYVVPYSNDRDLGNFFKPLPLDNAAERKLDKVAPPHETKELVATRLTCLMAAKTDLIGLLADPIVDPFFTIVTHDHNFFAAAGAVAAHSGKCVKRMTPVDPEGRPLLVAALIVKDEEEMLPGCLESLQPVVDRIEICDTGSTDGTVAIAKAAGANVIEREWPDDFAAARNYVLDQSRDARYVLVIDADERLECADPDQVRRYLATYSAEHRGLTIDVSNIDEAGMERNRFRSVRVFHAAGTEYRGAIHEIVHAISESDPLKGTFFSQLSMKHYGYAEDIVASKDKAGRNLALAEAAYATEPGPNTALHLARSLNYAGQEPERARTLLEEAWEGSQDATPTAQVQILTLLGDQCASLGDTERAFDLGRDALIMVPADDTAAALLATAADRLGRYEELIEIAQEVADAPSPPPPHFVPENRTTFHNGLARAYAFMGDAEKAVATAYELLEETPDDFEGWHPLVECLNGVYGSNALELVLPLALMDTVGGFIEPIIRTYPTGTLAGFCVAYATAGGEVPEAIRVGLLAAAMAGDNEAFRSLLPHADVLPADVRLGLANRVAGTGRTDLADKLRATPEQVAV